MNLASRIAQAMADNVIDRLPRLTANASPHFARDLLEAYYRLKDEIAKDRAAEGHRWSLEDRLAAASVDHQLDVAIESVRTWLSRVAKRGGRGLRLDPLPKESVRDFA